MGLVTGSIPNLVNGVSQQAPQLRLATQSEEQINYSSTVVKGLTKRPPLRHIAKLFDSLPSSTFIHTIQRDANEKYVVAVTDGGLQVRDFEGNTKTVSFPNGNGYLSSSDPKKDFAAVTLADYTFLVNKKNTVAMSASKSPTRLPEALIHVRGVNFGKIYEIKINGSTVAKVECPGSVYDNNDNANTAEKNTTNLKVANALYDGAGFSSTTAGGTIGVTSKLTTTLPSATWTVTLYQNVIHIVNKLGQDFTIEAIADNDDTLMAAYKGIVKDFSRLPNCGPNGIPFKVNGDESTGFDDFYVKLTKQNSADGNGIWEETVAQGMDIEFDASTMPHILVREADGAFTFKQAEWADREVGDNDTNPPPTFVGKTIEGITFTRGRIQMLSDENVITSGSNDFFRFWRQSTMTILDDDAIDVATTYPKVSLLKQAIPFNDDVLLFSDQTQFEFTGDDLLTPKSARIRPVGSYDSATNVAPVSAKEFVYFVANRGESATFYELSRDESTETIKAEEVNNHCPSYVPAGITKLAASTNEDTLFALTEGDPSTAYVYKWYWSGQDRLQASWSKWQFPSVSHLLDVAVSGSNLFVIAERDDGVFLEICSLDLGFVDDGLEYAFHLDRRVASEDLTISYDEVNDRTTFTLPFSEPEALTVVTRPNDELPEAMEVDVFSQSGNQIVVEGDFTEIPVFIGLLYTSRYRLSSLYPRQQGDGQSSSAITLGRTQVKSIRFQYADTAYFRVEVTPKARKTYRYEFLPRRVGDPETGSINVEDGSFRVPVRSKNDQVTIEVINDSFLPSSLLSADWLGTHTMRST